MSKSSGQELPAYAEKASGVEPPIGTEPKDELSNEKLSTADDEKGSSKDAQPETAEDDKSLKQNVVPVGFLQLFR